MEVFESRGDKGRQDISRRVFFPRRGRKDFATYINQEPAVGRRGRIWVLRAGTTKKRLLSQAKAV